MFGLLGGDAFEEAGGGNDERVEEIVAEGDGNFLDVGGEGGEGHAPAASLRSSRRMTLPVTVIGKLSLKRT